MGQIQSGTIIDALNKQQSKYFIKAKKNILAKYPCFKGYRRLPEDKIVDKKVPYDELQCYFIKLRPVQTENDIKFFQREEQILHLFEEVPQVLKNENTIDVTVNNQKYILIPSKFYVLTDVYEYLWHEIHYIDEKVMKPIVIQALTILKILKEYKVVHNGIKFENFIVESANPIKLIITDFKYAKVLKDDEKSHFYGGSSRYKAPEVLRKEGHDYQADIWSLGCNIYSAFFNKYPFDIEHEDEESRILYKIENHKLQNINNAVSEEVWDVISKMLVLDPNERITAEEALNTSWLQVPLPPAPNPGNIHLDEN